MIWFIVLPSAIALLLKGYALWYLRRLPRESINGELFTITLSLMAMNLTEFTGLSQSIAFGFSADGKIYLLLYYGLLCIFLAALLSYAAQEWSKRIGRAVQYIAHSTMAIVAAMIVFTDWIVAGYQPLGYSVTRIPGEFYWAFQTAAIVAVLATLIFLIANATKSTGDKQRKALAALVALLPLVITIGLVLILMASDVAINMTMFVSIATSFMLLILAWTQELKIRTRLIGLIPFTPDWRFQRHIIDTCLATIDKSLENPHNPELLKNTVRAFENSLITQALQSHNGNKTQTAKALGISKASFHRKKKYKDDS